MQILFILLLMQYFGSNSQDWVANACLQFMENQAPVVFCQSSVPNLPLDRKLIPQNIAKLRILGTSSLGQHNGILTLYNLTKLETLTYLEIGDFGLKEIEYNAFSGMKHLRVLDLSKNQISQIRPDAFAGPYLNLLSLADNRGLNLNHLSLRGARIVHFVARNCDLQKFDYEIVSEARPKQLSLSDNQIKWMDPRFANLIVQDKVSISDVSQAALDRVLGFLDLSNNPLNCDCQLAWLSRLIENQMYDVNQFINLKDPEKGKDLNLTHSSKDSQIRLMQQMNMTCASPPKLAGKSLPRSWDYFCPTPTVTGIEINFLHPEAYSAQITCIGRGRPAPSLAWTYNLNGQNVQQILNPYTKQSSHDDADYAEDNKWPTSETPIYDYPTELYERKLSLNVSLQSSNITNFTCTAWNNDKQTPFRLKSGENRYSSDKHFIHKLNTHSMIIPNGGKDLAPYYRSHQVTIRLFGRIKYPNAKREQTNQANVNLDKQIRNTNHNVSLSMSPYLKTETYSKTNQIAYVRQNEIYGYFFVKRFTVLELLGAIVGTFICTLALLYLATNCFSWFCQMNPLCSVKELRKSHLRPTGTHKWWLSWLNNHNNGFLLRSSNQSAASSSAAHVPNHRVNNTNINANLLNRIEMDNGSTFGDSITSPVLSNTINVCGQNIPQALLFTGLPSLPVDHNSTPPLNPAYWSMPEYAYSGAGSHEYDVPKPIETMVNEKVAFRFGQAESQTLNPNTSRQSFDPRTQIHRLNNGTMSSINTIQPLATSSLGPLSIQWAQNQANNNPLVNPLLAWSSNLTGNFAFPHQINKPIQNTVYNDQPFIYSADYPTYLQTRPYPNSLNQNQALIEAINAVSKNYASDQIAHTLIAANMNGEKSEILAKPPSTESNLQINGVNC